MSIISQKVFLTLLITTQILLASGIKPLTWDDLSSLDIQTGKVSPQLSKKITKKVSMSGFVIPLEPGKAPDTMSEMILVPDMMYCYHVPPPPANQIIEVILNQEASIEFADGPVKLTGTLQIEFINSRNYKYGYFFYANKIEFDADYEGTGYIAHDEEMP